MSLKDDFTERLVKLNNLRFKRWVFDAGMLFLSEVKWWGNMGQRGQKHNGLDLRAYENKEGAIEPIDERTKIPVLFDGVVAHVIKDFLGNTVFAAHKVYDKGARLFTAYGHVLQASGIHVGSQLKAGEVIGTPAAGKNTKVPLHFHLSIAFIPETILVDTISWELLDTNKEIIFLDPLEFVQLGLLIKSVPSSCIKIVD